MDKIIKFNLRPLRNNEHFQFMTDVDSQIATTTPETLGIASQYPVFKAMLNKEDITIRVEDGSSLSKTVDQLDKRRDKTWSAIANRVRATLRSPVVEEAESAILVERVINQYGNVRNISYNEETAAINNLVTDLQSETYVPHVEKIGLTGWVEELKNQNEQFVAAINQRNSELAGRQNGDVFSVRQEMDPLYEQLVDRINAAITLEMAADGVETFVNELNEKIRYYMNTLAIRQGRSQDDEAPDEEA